MVHSDVLAGLTSATLRFSAWLSRAALKNFISGFSTWIMMMLKANLVYSLSRLRRGPQIENDLKNKDDLKNEDNL